MLTGFFLFALGVVLTISANIGYGPWEVFHVGLAYQTGLSIGIASIFAGIALLVIVVLCKEKFGLGTVTGMVLTGLFVDLIIYIDVIPVSPNIAIGIAMLIVGLFIVSMGTYFYIRSAFGAGPRDNLMVVLTRKTKLPIGVCRGMVEVTATLVGWLLGGMVGIGTIISAFAIGFCVQITFKVMKFDALTVKHETLKQTYDNVFHKKF